MSRRKKAPPLYWTWANMKARCSNARRADYPNYGGRGIRVCDRWQTYENFAADMLPTYKPGLTLEREKTDGPYSPANCVWATRRQQANNTRTNAILEYQGERLTLGQWAVRTGIPRKLIWRRLRAGCTPNRVFARPSVDDVLIEKDGLRLSMYEWARRLAVPYSTIRDRHRRGLTTDQILSVRDLRAARISP